MRKRNTEDKSIWILGHLTFNLHMLHIHIIFPMLNIAFNFQIPFEPYASVLYYYFGLFDSFVLFFFICVHLPLWIPDLYMPSNYIGQVTRFKISDIALTLFALNGVARNEIRHENANFGDNVRISHFWKTVLNIFEYTWKNIKIQCNFFVWLFFFLCEYSIFEAWRSRAKNWGRLK